jgi:outer membrane protein OmpA-like peptidoglycan-associated protein
MKQNPAAVVLITGYADNATGTEKVNMHKSELRANAVAKALKEEGIAESRIKVDFKGASVQPYGTPAENRVAICIVQK